MNITTLKIDYNKIYINYKLLYTFKLKQYNLSLIKIMNEGVFMTEKNTHNYKKDVLRLATFIGQLMLSNGAETYRVDDTIKRICSSRGFTHINVFMAPNTIIVSDDRFDGYTFMKVIESRCINLNKIDLLNDFSRRFVSQADMSVGNAIKELKNIEEKSPHTQRAVNI